MATASLITNYLNGQSSPEEALCIERWIAASPENKRLFEEVWREWSSISGSEAQTHDIPDPQEEFHRWKQQLPRTGTIATKLYMLISAAGLLAVFVSYLLLKSPASAPHVQEQPVSAPLGADTGHVFNFKDTPLEEATRTLSKAYGVSFIADNPAIMNCRFTTGFDHDSLTYILDVITETLNIHYAYSPDKKTIRLSGEGCPAGN